MVWLFTESKAALSVAQVSLNLLDVTYLVTVLYAKLPFAQGQLNMYGAKDLALGAKYSLLK
ncbi:MAG: hypothetical protein NMK33_03695 [Candidatus Cardinium sp.]|nr:MAG: hypothetical protein NMK33_03695 [Candidatus Cardinium sp.]